MPHKRICLVLLCCVFVALALVVRVRAEQTEEQTQSSDETESLELLVEVLSNTNDSSIRAALLKGMLSGLEGRRHVMRPKGWSDLSRRLVSDDDVSVRDLSIQLSQIFGDVAAMNRSLALLQDKSADIGERRTALRSLMAVRNKEASSILESLLDEPDLRLSAIRGYAAIENAVAPSVLLGRYHQFAPEHRRAVVETLATREPYAVMLLAAIKNQTVPRDEIPVHVARSLNNLLGARFAKVFGEVKSIGADREKQIAKYKKMITPATLANADASRGRAVFNKTCAACHQLYGDGGKVGPDLTGSNRANLDYILLNSVDPSFDVPEGYRMVTVLTNDGRLINGVVAEEDGTRLILKTAEQPRVVIAKEDIEERSISDKSIMPDGQLDQLKPQEVIDLIKYLRTIEQVEIAQ